VSGVVADAFDRRRVMLLTQSAMALLAGLLAWLTLRGLQTPWPIYVVAALSSRPGPSTAGAARLIPNLVPRAHLANAISLNTIMFQAAAVAGPSARARRGHRRRGRRLSVQRGVVPVRDWRPPDDAGRQGQGQRVGGEGAPGSLSLGRRWKVSVSCSRSRSSVVGCCSTSSRRSSRRRRRCCHLRPGYLGVGAHGYGWLYAAPSIGASWPARRWCGSSIGSTGAASCCSGRRRLRLATVAFGRPIRSG